MKPSERIKEIVKEILSEGYTETPATLAAIIIYLDEQYEVEKLKLLRIMNYYKDEDKE
jgi:hypothetical protein